MCIADFPRARASGPISGKIFRMAPLCGLSRRLFPLIVVGLTLGGCAASPEGFSGLNLFSPSGSMGPLALGIDLPRDPAALGTNNAVEISLRNAVELAEQKRYREARDQLAEIQVVQVPDSDGYRAITSSMAILALREGDMGTFRRLARQLDISLGIPVRVDPAYVEVITLNRILSRKSLPVNAPAGLRSLEGTLPGEKTVVAGT